MTSQLVGSDFTAGAQLPNYVNGRLLTAEDLATGQATLRARDLRLGRAAGHGVVDGLWVTATATTLTVAPGLGIASSGDAINVGASVTLPLTFTASATGTGVGASFSCCAPGATPGGVAVTAGCYLLTALPACQLSGQAPLAAAPDSTVPAGCAAQWQVEGVQFKAITLPLAATVAGVPVTDANRRNLLAHWCFGSPALAKLGADPFNFPRAYGGLDSLDPADLTPADLPLAVFYWTGKTVDFVDNWSARRRVTAPDPVSASWSAVVADRRIADGQARLLQFQDQAGQLVASGAAGKIDAASTFPFLPPVGFLAIGVQHITPLFERLRGVADRIQKLRIQTEDAGTKEPEAVDEKEGTPVAEKVTGRAKVNVAALRELAQPDEVAGVAGAAEAEEAVKPGDAVRLAAPSLFATSHEQVLYGLATQPKEGLDKVFASLSAKTARPGFDLQVFFGAVATCGGVLDWEIADFALRQSWENAPVVTGAPAATTPGAAAPPAPMVYYLVLQNVQAGAGAGTGPDLYVVFMKKNAWLSGTQLPFMAPQSPASPDI